MKRKGNWKSRVSMLRPPIL